MSLLSVTAASSTRQLKQLALPAGQTCIRTYAAKASNARVVKQPTAQGSFKKDKGDSKAKKRKTPLFMPLAASQLQDPIYAQLRVGELDLPKFSASTVSSDSVGTAVSLSNPNTEAYRTKGIPNNIFLDFRMLSKHATVIRDASLQTFALLDEAAQKSSAHTRRVLTGSHGCGKSTLLMHAVEYCASAGWIVLYIPKAFSMVDSSSTYIYDPRTRIYTQPAYATQILRRFLSVNKSLLSQIKTTQEILFERRPAIAAGTGLVDVIDLAIRDSSLAPTVAEAILKELGQQTQHPVLLAVDDVQALYGKSYYRDPYFNRIDAQHLSTPRLLLEYISGRKTFQRGAVLSALSTLPAHPLTPELAHALELPHEDVRSVKHPYTQGLVPLPVPEALTVKEAAGVFEVWTNNRTISAPQSDETFLAKYAESSGNAKKFVWKGVLASLTS